MLILGEPGQGGPADFILFFLSLAALPMIFGACRGIVENL